MQDIETTSGESLWGSAGGSAAANPTAQAAPAHRLAIVPNTQNVKPPADGARMERRTVSDNDDQATAATVAMMCDYIRAGVKDPQVQAWAKWALECFGMGVDDARAKFWGVFWCLKHAVKYRQDEPALFRLGERNARDLLTAPAVLVRQASPEEDCDGFTMLACAMLQILGVPAFVVTVKADPKDPSRWSHVFALADVQGVGLCALDATPAGLYPGWMVPRQHIFNYQVWDLTGKPIHKKLPVVQPRLNGYEFRARGMGARPGAVRRRRGVGDDFIDPSQSAIDSLPVNQQLTDTELNQPWLFNTSPSSGLPQYELAPLPAAATTSQPGTWQNLINQIFGAGTKIAAVATAPAGSTVSPSGAVTIGGAPVQQLVAGITNLLPWILVGGLVIYGVNAASSSTPARRR